MTILSSETLRSRSDRRLKRNAAAVYGAAASGIRPDPQELVSDWAARFRVVSDMGAVPGPWRNDTAPYLIEPMDSLSPEDPVDHVSIMGPAQAGKSAVAENWLGFIMHRTPGPAMYVGPTVVAAKDWHQEKLKPTIEATAVLNPRTRGVVAPTTSRSGEGSTTNRIKFRGGYLLLAGANSAASLRQHSIRFMVRDDRSAWTDNADGEGDPKDLSDKRLKTYRRFGLAKVLDVSSPKFKGADIDADFEAGDRRRYYLACLGCGSLTDYDWADVRHNPEPPYRSHVECPACKRLHYDVDKSAMSSPSSGACWIPTAPDANGEVPPKTLAPDDVLRWRLRHTGRTAKSYAITGVINAFDTWDALAAGEAAAGDDPEKVQPFQNGDLGQAYEPKGEGPAWEALSARREPDWERGQVPAGVLYITLTVDVKGDGLHWQRKGWGPGKQSWHLDYGFIAGETDAPLEGAWRQLDQVAERGIRFGPLRLSDDMIGVDSGYNTNAVYAWVRRRHNALALKGVDGWNKLPIFRAEKPDVQTAGLARGQLPRHGLKVWLVGTYGIKGALMIYLARTPKEGGVGFPTGYHHFPRNAEEEYFRHLSSEYVATTEVNGEVKRTWERRGPNHWLDCEVYGWALAFYAGLWSWSEARWAERAAELTKLTRAQQSDLFAETAAAVNAPAVPADTEPESEQPAPVAVRPAPSSASLDRLASLNQ